MLEDPIILNLAITEINNLLSQIPEDWDPHKRLEYMKVTIRSVVSDLVGRNKRETNKEIKELEDEINEMHALKIDISNISEIERRNELIQLSNMAINSMEDDLKILRNKQSSNTSFRAKSKWYEYGEKSNKYFLNLNKVYKKQKLIAT